MVPDTRPATTAARNSAALPHQRSSVQKRPSKSWRKRKGQPIPKTAARKAPKACLSSLPLELLWRIQHFITAPLTVWTIPGVLKASPCIPLLLASRNLELDHVLMQARPLEIFLGQERTTSLLGLSSLCRGKPSSILRLDSAKLLQAMTFHNVIVIHPNYGHGVAGERTLKQIELLQSHRDRTHTMGKRVIVDLTPWLTARYILWDGHGDLDTGLIKRLERWLTSNENVSIYPRIPDIWDDIYVHDRKDDPIIWSDFWHKFSDRFVDVLPC